MRKVIVSFYTSDAPEVAIAQKSVLDVMTPPGFDIQQIIMNTNGFSAHNGINISHGGNIDIWMKTDDHDLIVLLDIDCVPIHPLAILKLTERAMDGTLAGAAYRAPHLANGNHIYVGPFAMAFTRRLWIRLGEPSFQPTYRGDTAEELTYIAEDKKLPIAMLLPTEAEHYWYALIGDDVLRYGTNTVYDRAFLHTGAGVRAQWLRQHFVDTCARVLRTKLIEQTFNLNWVSPDYFKKWFPLPQKIIVERRSEVPVSRDGVPVSRDGVLQAISRNRRIQRVETTGLFKLEQPWMNP